MKFKFSQNVDNTSNVTDMQIGVTGIFKVKDNKLKKNIVVEKEFEWAFSHRTIFATCIK